MTLVILTSTSSAALVAEAAKGCNHARTVLHAANRLLWKIQRRTRGKAMPCFLCGGELWSGEAPAAVGVLMPYGIDCIRTAIGFGFCSACAADRAEAELAQAVVHAFRAGLMPDLRQIQPMMQAGHA